MNHKEKLIEIINNVIRCDKCGIVPEWLAENLIFYGVTAQEWVSVKDRLPEDGQIVLTYKNGICDIQTYEARRNGWLCKGWFWSMATVTHWMPMPQPPKGE